MNNCPGEYVSILKNTEGKSHLLTMIFYLAAPTLALKKPSSLISFSRNSHNLYTLWEMYKDDVTRRVGIKYIELRKTKENILVLFYNPIVLNNTLFRKRHRDFLSGYGYRDAEDLSQHLELLKKSFAFGFPHEIGIFLGIPLEDVQGFIENRGKKCLVNKYWKVYHNQERARRIFLSYDNARRDMMVSLEKQYLKLSV